jgi:hypothetical protein
MRGPVKFFLLATLALALLCGRGLDRAAERGRRWALVPAVLVLLLAVLASRWPGAVTAALGVLFPGPNPALVHDVVARLWPAELLATGTAALGAGLALARGGRVAVLAGVLAAVDLLRVNGGLNPTAPASFYELRPEVRAAVADAQAEGRYRWFTYGAGYAEALRWRPEVARTRRDVWLYAVDRQALVPRSHVIDGLEGAFDVDRMGLAPEGAALPVAEMRPSAHAALQRRLELANVRFILSFDAIEDARLRLRATIDIGEVLEPLRLHEVRRPLPRAFFVPRHEVEPSPEARRTRLEGFDPREAVILDSEPPAGPWIRTLPSIGSTDAPRGPAGPGESPASVTYDLVDPHTVRVASATPPGYVVVLDGHHPDWTAHDERGAPVPVLRANGRYRAIPTPGGRHVFTLRYRPRWLTLALGSLAAGLAAAAVLAGVSEFTARRGTRRANLRAGTQE